MDAHNAYAATPLSSSRIILYPLASFLSVAVSVVCLYFASATEHVSVHVVCILLGIVLLFTATFIIKTTFDDIEHFNETHRRMYTAPQGYGAAQAQGYGGVYAGQSSMGAKRI